MRTDEHEGRNGWGHLRGGLWRGGGSFPSDLVGEGDEGPVPASPVDEPQDPSFVLRARRVGALSHRPGAVDFDLAVLYTEGFGRSLFRARARASGVRAHALLVQAGRPREEGDLVCLRSNRVAREDPSKRPACQALVLLGLRQGAPPRTRWGSGAVSRRTRAPELGRL